MKNMLFFTKHVILLHFISLFTKYNKIHKSKLDILLTWTNIVCIKNY